MLYLFESSSICCSDSASETQPALQSSLEACMWDTGYSAIVAAEHPLCIYIWVAQHDSAAASLQLPYYNHVIVMRLWRQGALCVTCLHYGHCGLYTMP